MEIGIKVKKIRSMTKAELQSEGWEGWNPKPIVIEFDDGSKIYPSQDSEGNGPGAMFGVNKKGQHFQLG